MIKTKKLILASLTLLASGFLASCSGGIANSTNTFSYVYSADPEDLNYIKTSYATTSEITNNLIDGLLENDQYGNLIPSLAESWTVSPDGKVYTYNLRKDAKWYTFEGEEYDSVTAHDFVTGLKYAADSESSAYYLVKDSIAGLKEYMDGQEKDFSKVGIKALDDYTIQYTLNAPEPYWNSKTTSGILMPVNEKFLKSKGDSFATLDPSTLLYNGPYLLKSITSKSSIELSKNEDYYDKDKVEIENVRLTYYDGQDQEALVNGYDSGNYTIARLYPNSSNYSSVEKKYGKNVVFGPQDATSYFNIFNLNRQSYNYTSKKTDAQKKSTQAAVRNKDFRQAVNFAIDRKAYKSQSNGEENSDKGIRNVLVAPNFVQVDGKDYADKVASDLVTYGTEWTGIKLSDAQDAYYNKEKAQAEFAKAKEALEAEGVEFPIHLDLPVDQSSTIGDQTSSSIKQSIESTLGQENVIVDLQKISTDDFQKATAGETAAQEDYDLSGGGWSPDYQDPKTYLDVYGSREGYYLKAMGLDPEKDQNLIQSVGLTDYQALLDEADSEKVDVNSRYSKYASAEAWLIDSGLMIPITSDGGTPRIGKKVPFSGAYSLVGSKAYDMYTFKYLKLQDETVTTEEYDQAKKKWEEERQESNKKFQDDLQSHIK